MMNFELEDRSTHFENEISCVHKFHSGRVFSKSVKFFIVIPPHPCNFAGEDMTNAAYLYTKESSHIYRLRITGLCLWYLDVNYSRISVKCGETLTDERGRHDALTSDDHACL